MVFIIDYLLQLIIRPPRQASCLTPLHRGEFPPSAMVPKTEPIPLPRRGARQGGVVFLE